MKDKLMSFCRNIGIEYAGIAPAKPLEKLRSLLEERVAMGHNSSFEEKSIEKRIDPSLELEGVKCIIVCLFPYYTGFNEEANISNYTYARDYHIAVKEKLIAVGEYLKKQIEGFKYKAHIDTGPLPDRYLAYLAGLGFYGINSHIINEKYGSYVFIGYILCNYPFEADRPLDRTCIKCGECVKACPGGAILGNFNINPNRCKSYLTQKKGELSDDEVNIIKKSQLVFGCDICQRVCPHNREISATDIMEFSENQICKIDYDVIKDMTNKEFKNKYGDRAFSWRGKRILKRNFEYIKENK